MLNKLKNYIRRQFDDIFFWMIAGAAAGIGFSIIALMLLFTLLF